MIDKITPHPDSRVTEQLEADGLEGIRPFVTAMGTCVQFKRVPLSQEAPAKQFWDAFN